MSEIKKLFTNSFIIFVGTIVGSIFAYLFNMMMGRLLGPEQYGELTALMSLMMIVAAGGSAITIISMKYSADYFNQKKIAQLKKFILSFSKIVLLLGIILVLIGMLFSSVIVDFLSGVDKLALTLVLFNLIFGLLIVLNKGALQGLQRFLSVSVIGSVEMFLRLGLGLLLVYLGYQLNGAILAIILATALAYSITFWPMRDILQTKEKIKSDEKIDTKSILAYSWPTLIATLLLVFGINFDIIIIKHYFAPEQAGMYAAVSTIAKIIFYLTGPIATVMFPMISENISKKIKHYRLFLLSVIMTLLASLIVLGAYTVAPGKIINLLYGSSYVEFYYLLPEVGLVMVLYSLINLVVNYYLVLKNFLFLWIFSIGIIVQIILISFFHESILQVVRMFILSFSAIFVCMFVYYLYLKWDNIKLIISENGKS